MSGGKPQAEVDIDARLVRRLLHDQHPDLAALSITGLADGWDNVMFRLGEALTVRMPRREVAARLLVNEQTWLPLIEPRLPIAISARVRIGEPTDDYPWHWSVLPWFDGVPADQSPPGSDQADAFAEFLLRLHELAPADAPENPVRGIPLANRADSVEERLSRLRARTDQIKSEIEAVWQRGLSAPIAEEGRWLHGDLHSQNVLVHEGHIRAIVDWGDLTSGDVATDLAATWMLFPDRVARQKVLEIYSPDQHTLDRAKGWAVLFAAVLLDSGLINSPRHALMGKDTFERLGADA